MDYKNLVFLSVIRAVMQTDISSLVRLDLISVWVTKTQYLLAQFFYLTFRHDHAHVKILINT